MKISKKIIDIRNNNNLTQEDLADILCVSRQTISNWENDKCYPDIETLTMISDKFNVSLDLLLKDDEEMIKDISKKIKKNKISKLVIVALVISMLIMVWLGYKIYLVCYYNNGYSNNIFNNFIESLEELKIDTDKSIANQKFKDLNIYIPERLYKAFSGKFGYSITGYEITITTYDSLFPSLYYNTAHLKNINYEKVFSKYNINNQIDLINYYKNDYENKINIFWNKSKLELRFLTEYFIVQDFYNKGNFNKCYYFSDGIIGKMREDNYEYKIEIYYDNVTYSISIKKPFFDLEDVMYILNSIYFEKDEV